MRTEYKLFLWFLTPFFFVAAAGYFYFTKGKEPIGVVGFIMAGLLVAMIGGYALLLSRKMDMRPEDRPDGEIAEGAGELGFFPARSIWPLWVALTISVMALGPVFGWWITILGVGMGIWSLSGWVYEYYRGPYKH